MLLQRIQLFGLVVLSVPFLLSVEGCQKLPGSGGSASTQGWVDEQRKAWYQGTQGSRLLPRSWFDALEQAQSEQPFASIDNLAQFGFLAPPANHDTSLPIGFAVDRQSDEKLQNSKLRWYPEQPSQDTTAEPWIGLNCSACHTASMSYEGTSMVVDGGPGLVDFQLFIEALDASLIATKNDGEKWERFASTVLTERDSPEARAMLNNAFEQLLDWQALTDAMNETPMRYGYGRLDAVGHILNKILMFNGADQSNGNPSNAPVSYPFLWDIWRQQRVQWNGVAENSRLKTPGDAIEYGALGRNTGEVLGVFGDLHVIPREGTGGAFKGYESSVDTRNLMRMELLLQSLDTPTWPDHFPSIDTSLAEQGKGLFKQNCTSCHLTPDLQSSDEPTEVMLSFQDTSKENLTDIWMACNAYINDGPTGPMQGTKDNDGNILGEVSPVATMLATAVKGALIQNAGDLVKEGVLNFASIRRLPEVDRAQDPFDPRARERSICLQTQGVDILAYKARPLDGIWATAPYLHNGSVSSLYELLLPADERLPEFWVGNREYDPVGVGYLNQEPADKNAFLLDTTPEGNRNSGHQYGADQFSDADRFALVEYMKTL